MKSKAEIHLQTTFVWLRDMDYPCCASRETQQVAQNNIALKTEIGKNAAYL